MSRALVLLALISAAAALPITNNGSNTTNTTSASCDPTAVYPCSDTVTGNLILMAFYGVLLGAAAKLISDGAEMLLDLGFSPALIGGLVLPVLGAVPDAAIIIVSGLGPVETVQEQLSVGMGTLAGSTIMLLTIPWLGGMLLGRCDLDASGEAVDEVLTRKCDMKRTGVTVLKDVKLGVLIMIATTLPYFIIQSADWAYGPTKPISEKQPEYVRNAALATMVFCIIGFVAFSVYQVMDGVRASREAKLIMDRKRKATFQVVLASMYMANLVSKKKEISPEQALEDPNLPGHSIQSTNAARKLGSAWKRSVAAPVAEPTEEENLTQPLLSPSEVKAAAEIEEKEEPKWKTACKCVGLLAVGVGIVTVFSDPMCDVLTALTNTSNTSYIPNASELISSLIFAAKKKRETISMTYAQLYGAATMNNTLCLAIFMALVYFRELEWVYSAEVLTIILVQFAVGAMSYRFTYPLWLCIPIICLYPLSIALVAILEGPIGWF